MGHRQLESIQRPNATVEAVLWSFLTHDDDVANTCTVRHNQAMAAFVHDDKKNEEWLWKPRDGQPTIAKQQA
jgi:hypothetical protein